VAESRTSSETPPRSSRDRELDEFISRCHEALSQQSQGHPGPLLDLWSRADDVTIMAAIGGHQTGFGDVSALLSAASETQHFDGWSSDNIVTIASADLALSVELEHYAQQVDGEGAGMTLRATQVYRREDGAWRLIHRHGDILAPIEAKW
jgi:ketosteroid isomerase-like protein